MKKFFAIASITLISLSSFAGVSLWQLTDEEHFNAPDNESFIYLQSEFPQYFGDLDGTSVSSATLDLYDFDFVGPTQCPADDPRLHAQTVSKSVCFNSGSCMGMTSPTPAPVDPCL